MAERPSVQVPVFPTGRVYLRLDKYKARGFGVVWIPEEDQSRSRSLGVSGPSDARAIWSAITKDWIKANSAGWAW